jgi:hypothetical protein
MKKRLALWNVLLLACAIAGGMELRREWQQTQAKQNLILRPRRIPTPKVDVAPPPPKPNAFQAMGYTDVAQKMLFAKDRNPTQIIDAPAAPPPPPPPPPPLPHMYGVLGLPSGPVAIMTEKAGGEQTKVRQGENIGEYKVTKLDTQRITLVWKDKTFNKTVDELLDRTPAPAAVAAPVVAAAASTATTAKPAGPAPPPQLGPDTGNGIYACKQDDTSPAGTQLDGYKKSVEQTPFGPRCSWSK